MVIDHEKLLVELLVEKIQKLTNENEKLRKENRKLTDSLKSTTKGG